MGQEQATRPGQTAGSLLVVLLLAACGSSATNKPGGSAGQAAKHNAGEPGLAGTSASDASRAATGAGGVSQGSAGTGAGGHGGSAPATGSRGEGGSSVTPSASPHGPLSASELEAAGCDVARPAIRYRASATASTTPERAASGALAAVPCHPLRDYGSSESSLGITSDGVLFYAPAFTNDAHGVLRSKDSGVTWELIVPKLPNDGTHGDCNLTSMSIPRPIASSPRRPRQRR